MTELQEKLIKRILESEEAMVIAMEFIRRERSEDNETTRIMLKEGGDMIKQCQTL